MRQRNEGQSVMRGRGGGGIGGGGGGGIGGGGGGIGRGPGKKKDLDGQRFFLFSKMSKEKRAQIQMDDEAWYSVTDQRTAERTSKLMMKLVGINAESTITDGTACVGGNVMSFSKFFAKVCSIVCMV
jgi:hypothetical protein